MPKKLGHLDPVRSPAYSNAGRENHEVVFNRAEYCTACDGLGHKRGTFEVCNPCNGTGHKKGR